MRRPLFFTALVFFVSVLLYGTLPAFAGGVIIRNGATLTLNEMTLDLNCLDLIVETGGTFDLASGEVIDCGRLIVDDGGSLIQGTGTIEYCEAVLAPTAITQDATGVDTTSATLHGLANANGGSTDVIFEYGLTDSYGSTVIAAQSPINGTTNTGVSAWVTGLAPGTTYHFRVVAQNTVGTTYGSNLTFTTASTAISPTATTWAATAITTSTATLNATVNANGDSAIVTFQYGLTNSYGSTVNADQSPVTGTTNTAVSFTLSSLTNNTTYHYRVVATSANGTTYGGDVSFTTGVTPPTVTTNNASGVGTTAAILNGVVNANGNSTTVTFEYGLTTDYDNIVIAVPGTVTGFSNTAVSAALSALLPNTTYYFRAVGANAGGTTFGSDMTFTTLSSPTVITNEASGISTSGATLNGEVNANGTSTTVIFQYGLTTTYGNTLTADQSPVPGSTPTAVSRVITGLSSNTLYHYRAVGQNTHGTTYGADMTFFTTSPAAPSAYTNAATLVIANGAALNGTVNANNASTTVTFQYGLTDSYGITVAAVPGHVSGITNTAVSAAIGELLPNSTYHFRVVATNASGTDYGDDMTFTTLDIPPSVATAAAIGIGADFATLTGTVNAHGCSTTVEFEYGTDTSYGTTVTADQSPVSSTNTIPVTNTLTGLANNTTYHYRIKASNVNGTSYGQDASFTIGTLGTAPAAATNAASAIGTTTATLNGTVNAGDSATAVIFEYGLTTGYGSFAVATQSPVTGTTDTAVSASISELLPNTTYHYRTTAANLNGSDFGADMTFTTLPLAPAAATNGAMAVGTTTATLNGTVNANGASSTVTFQYGLSTAYGTTVPATESPVNGTTDTSVSRAITGLTNGITYHYRVVAVNAGGTTYGADMIFTTGVTAPAATTNAATGVGTTAATLNGTVNANGSSATVTFQYGLNTSYGRTIAAVPGTVSGSSNTAVNVMVSDLSPNMTYHYRVVAVNAGGTTYGEDIAFTTGSGPAVTTMPASSVTPTGATLNGTVNANGSSTTVTFEYGLTTAYGITLPADQSPVTGSVDTPVSTALTGLPSSTTYHYRVVGQNSGGTTTGADMTFTTSVPDPNAPVATTNAAVGVGPTGATLAGTVESKNQSTTVTFEYGLTTAYGTTVTAEQSPVQNLADSDVSRAITGLTSGVTYHYRVVAQNAYGTGYGADMTFYTSTPAAPTATTNAATSLGTTSVTLNGTVNPQNNSVTVFFQYGLTTSYGTVVTASTSTLVGITDIPVSANITGLLNNTTYHYRVYTYCTSFGYTFGKDMTFTTGLTAPTAVTNAATAVGTNSATLNGTVNANNTTATATFEYGETTGYGRSVTATQSPVTGSADTSVSASLSLLDTNTTYHYRVVAQNTDNTVYGADMTFTTSGLPPIASTNSATGVSGTGATLNGTVNANNDSTTVTFQYGLTTAYGTTVTADQSPVTGTDNTAVSFTISGLTNNTTYHYRVAAQNSSGTTYGADMTFFTGTAPPAVTTGGATNIGPDSAILHGTVNPNNASTTVTFEFGETTGYGRTAAADQSPVTGSGDTPVSANIDLLNADTLYHYRVCAVNSAGTTCGADMTFTTNAAGTPIVTTANVMDIAATSATGGGNVTDEGSAPVTARGVCWSTSASPTTADSITSDGTGAGVFTSSLTGLSPLTAYYVRAYATNLYGTVYGEERSFTTLPFPPAVTTDAATAVGPTSATLNGTVNANGDSTAVTFEYGLTTAYGTTVTATPSPVAGSIDTAVSRTITGLTNGTTYHYRVVAENTGGKTYGEDMTFTTTDAPSVTTDAAADVGINGATLNGTVNANGDSTTVAFEYGLDTGYGNTVPADQNPVTGYGATAVSAGITGLVPDTTYHFRVVAQNSVGTTYGGDMEFKTDDEVPIPTLSETGIIILGIMLMFTGMVMLRKRDRA